MKRLYLVILGLGFVSTAATAEENFSVKAKVISSDSNLKANSVQVAGNGVSGTRTLSGDDDSTTAIGYGADFDARLAEIWHAGAGVAFTDYMNDNEKTSYKDTAHRVYGGIDFFTQPNYALNFQTGVSYHYLTLKDTQIGPATVEYKDLDLWNFDVGVGINGTVAKNMTMGLGYQYTGTFQSKGVDVNYAGPGVISAPERLKDIKLSKNEVAGSVGVTF